MNFGGALERLHEGDAVSRTGWNGKHKLYMLEPEDADIVNRNYIAIETESGDIIPWVASMTDLLGEDWKVVE